MEERFIDPGEVQEFGDLTQEDATLLVDSENTGVKPSGQGVGSDDFVGGIGDMSHARNAAWGSLKRRDGTVEVNFYNDRCGFERGYTLGRSDNCDIVVACKNVSKIHCCIYCQFQEARMKVFLRGISPHGTYVNSAYTKILEGKIYELKTGDDIFLVNPLTASEENIKISTFMFVNILERLTYQRAIGTAPESTSEGSLSNKASASSDQQSFNGNQINRMIEDHYIIGEQIGFGMCGQVHMCVHKAQGHYYAVKIIDTKKYSLTPGLSIAELKQEASMMKELDHPNIVRIVDTFESDTKLYIVMELIRGGDLFDRIVEKGKYQENQARKLMKNILSAVEYLHDNNIVHRDLKPENILLVDPKDDYEIRITDFGFAKRASQDGLKTFCGTPQYFAPEVLKRKGSVRGLGRYDKAVDMWSIGVILYILLSGSFPFDENDMLGQIEKGRYTLTSSEWDSISRPAKQMIAELLTLDPSKRLTVKGALNHCWITEEYMRPPNPALQAARPSILATSRSPVKSAAKGMRNMQSPMKPSRGKSSNVAKSPNSNTQDLKSYFTGATAAIAKESNSATSSVGEDPIVTNPSQSDPINTKSQCSAAPRSPNSSLARVGSLLWSNSDFSFINRKKMPSIVNLASASLTPQSIAIVQAENPVTLCSEPMVNDSVVVVDSAEINNYDFVADVIPFSSTSVIPTKSGDSNSTVTSLFTQATGLKSDQTSLASAGPSMSVKVATSDSKPPAKRHYKRKASALEAPKVSAVVTGIAVGNHEGATTTVLAGQVAKSAFSNTDDMQFLYDDIEEFSNEAFENVRKPTSGSKSKRTVSSSSSASTEPIAPAPSSPSRKTTSLQANKADERTGKISHSDSSPANVQICEPESGAMLSPAKRKAGMIGSNVKKRPGTRITKHLIQQPGELMGMGSDDNNSPDDPSPVRVRASRKLRIPVKHVASVFPPKLEFVSKKKPSSG